ncbi:2-keto-4-pentenoate hydratase [Enterococcus sp. BWR-S5]|uniref:2-keto-4-pentenoate hydratase n=1 Tax=Enterococcus sp. BWR-S5 TaxID=2787714 RepID=UPI001920B5B5|nr:2-keto-4-pentenoate hydratase [Enterococcus sp. BWR-S5]MBL1223610.1 2-keto-4-pentenoate hydratase [Enterococcus sp. BWR-S5]
MTIDANRLSAHLSQAFITKGSTPLTEVAPGLTVQEAYLVQLATIEKELAQGRRITGKKIGLTSAAMQQSLGVNEPDYGHLLDSMEIQNNGKVSPELVLQPRVEGEIAFILKEDLKGPNVTAFDVIQATDYIVPAIEIVDSRIKDWKLTLQDTVGDNASSGLYVLGENQFRLPDVDLRVVGMALYKNGILQNTGTGAACLDNPINAVVWLANKLANYDIYLKKGEVILSGALSAAIPAEAGDFFEMKFNQMGSVNVSF